MHGDIHVQFRRHVIIVMVFLIIWMTRIPYLNNSAAELGEMWRQADTESIARNFVKYRFQIFYPQFNYDGTPPTYVQLEFQITTFLIAILYKMFGIHIWLARLVPICFFMFSVLFLYLIAKMFFSTAQALTVIVIYSMLPITIYFSRAIMPEAALLCFFTGAFFYFQKWLVNERFQTLIAAAVFMCLAISQKPPAAFMGLTFVVLAWGKYGTKIWKKWHLLIFAIVSLVPEAIYFLWSGTIAKQQFVSKIALKHIIPEFFTAIVSPEAARFYVTKLPEAFSVPVLALSLISIFTMFQKKDRPILCWAAAMLLETAFIVSVIQFKYYLIMLSPILALLSGKTLGMLWGKSTLGKTILLLFLFVFAYTSYDAAQKDFKVKQELVKGAEIINAHTNPQDLIVIGTADPVMLSLSDRAGWRANIKYYDEIPQTAAEEISYFIQHGADYFLVYRNFIYDDDGSYIQYLNDHFQKETYGPDFVMYQLH